MAYFDIEDSTFNLDDDYGDYMRDSSDDEFCNDIVPVEDNDIVPIEDTSNDTDVVESRIDCDAYFGRDEEKRSLTHELESLDERTLELLKRAAVSTGSVIAHIDEENQSLWLFNRMAGQSISVRATDDRTEDLLLFSIFERHDPATIEKNGNFMSAEAYGGTITQVANSNEELKFVPNKLRPAIMDRCSNTILSLVSQIGWRMLMHTNRGDDDPVPTCLVALQGFVACAELQDDKYVAVNETRDEKIKEHFSTILEYCREYFKPDL